VVEWLPLLVAGAYVVVVALEFPALVRAVYWDSDAAGAFVLAQTIPGHHGTVEIPRFGWWASLWWLLATRWLPGHARVWEATAYPFALGTAAIVGWATWRVAGRGGGIAAAATTIVVGPIALTSLMLVNFHTSTPFTAAVLAAYLVLLSMSRSWVLAGLVGLLAGVNAASDPLLWVAGVAPFVLAACVLAFASRSRRVLSRTALVVGVAVPVALATDAAMRSFGYHVIPAGVQLARLSDLGSNVMTVGKSIAILFGANFLSRPTYPSDPLRYLVALLGFAALAATLVAAVRLGVRRSNPTAWAYACFWALAVALVSVAYGASNLAGAGGFEAGVDYLLVLAPAAGAGIALVAAGSATGRVVASIAIGLVGVTNLLGIAHGRPQADFTRPYGDELVRLLEQKGLTRGYGPFQDAQSATWKSGMRLLVAPVYTCAPDGTLCPNRFFTIDSWYAPRPGRSFLITDPALGLSTRPPGSYGRPSEIDHVTPDVTVYVYPHDLARHIRK
jgi:hypothetical protein